MPRGDKRKRDGDAPLLGNNPVRVGLDADIRAIRRNPLRAVRKTRPSDTSPLSSAGSRRGVDLLSASSGSGANDQVSNNSSHDQSAAGTLRQSSRVKVKIETPFFIEAPIYGEVGPYGGTSVSVILGIGADNAANNQGSQKTDDGRKRPMKDLLTYAPGEYISGHLLNANHGGRGDEKRNISPQTIKANMDQKTPEGLLKDSITTLRQALEFGRKMEFAPHLGFKYEVKVSDREITVPSSKDPKKLLKLPESVNISMSFYKGDDVPKSEVKKLFEKRAFSKPEIKSMILEGKVIKTTIRN